MKTTILSLCIAAGLGLSVAEASIIDTAKTALQAKVTSQETLLSQLKALNTTKPSTSSIASLQSAYNSYNKADAAWDLVEDKLTDAQEDSVEALFPQLDSLDKSIEAQAAILLLKYKLGMSPDLGSILKDLAD